MANPPLSLMVRITLISPREYRMEIERSDGSTDSKELEIRSCLQHDLVHMALENAAGLTESFFGRLARGASFDNLDPGDLENPDELMQTESVVGPIQGAWRKDFDPEAFLTRLTEYRQSIGENVPPWLTLDVLERTANFLRTLDGSMRSKTYYGEPIPIDLKLG